MKTVQFQHDPKTGYVQSKQLRPLPSSLKDSMGSGTLFSFRSFEKGQPDLIINKLHAAKRPTKIFGEGAYYPSCPSIALGRSSFSQCGRNDNP